MKHAFSALFIVLFAFGLGACEEQRKPQPPQTTQNATAAIEQDLRLLLKWEKTDGFYQKESETAMSANAVENATTATQFYRELQARYAQMHASAEKLTLTTEQGKALHQQILQATAEGEKLCRERVAQYANEADNYSPIYQQELQLQLHRDFNTLTQGVSAIDQAILDLGKASQIEIEALVKSLD